MSFGIARRSPALGLLLLFCLIPLACAHQGQGVADTMLLAQDAGAYLGQGAWRMKPKRQAARVRVFLAKYFQCWHGSRGDYGPQGVRDELAKFAAEPGFGENLLPRDPAWLDGIAWSLDLAGYPNADWPGITVEAVSLRLLPSADPILGAVDRPGQGFAFDRLQQSAAPPNLPVWVHHHTRDGSWLLVESPIAWGWLPAASVARMSPGQTAAFEKGPFRAVVRDGVAMQSQAGRFLFHASLGCLLPALDGGGSDGMWAAVRDHKGRAVLMRAQASPGGTEAFPLELNSANLARLANRMMGSPYGWGGQFGNRDCSSTLMDLFSPFGLWLPRNSGDQARRGGRLLDLAGLTAPEKRSTIANQGIPLLSLVWLPGHIMLYLGQAEGQPVVFHNAWGLKTWSLFKGEGRRIIGRAVVTGLEPGAELPQLARPQGLLINRVEGLVLLARPGELERD